MSGQAALLLLPDRPWSIQPPPACQSRLVELSLVLRDVVRRGHRLASSVNGTRGSNGCQHVLQRNGVWL